METLGQRLQLARRAGGLTQMDVARRLMVEKSTVSRWETDALDPGIDRVAVLVELFGFDQSVKSWVAFGGAVPRSMTKAMKERSVA